MTDRTRTISRREVLAAVGVVGASMGFGGGSQPRDPGQDRARAGTAALPVKALVFDVFGTVVDWRSSIAHEVEALAKRNGFGVDGAKFADAWRAEYGPSMNRVRTGALPWTRLDDLHRMVLDKILADFGIVLSE